MQHKLIRGLMRVMTSCALSFLYRRMDNLTGKLLFMALITEFAYILYGLERVFCSQDMAYGTLAD